eukprot:GHVO01040906.1.p1 GENE.GHVO01040906.1~~GHVO01040906.1.p1  ORF type:complete len:227 (-),score=29.64 GHVO01040906.1:42-722(-)
MKLGRYKCPHCSVDIEWWDTTHDKHCIGNPSNACLFCGDNGGGVWLDEKDVDTFNRLRDAHESECSGNPRNRPIDNPVCKFRRSSKLADMILKARLKTDQRLSWSSTGGLEIPCIHCDQPVSEFHLVRHEDNCLRNEFIQCRYCYTPCPQYGDATPTEHRKRHEAVCTMNPANAAYCKYCGLTFRSSETHTASALALSHEKRCRSNTDNHCDYCGYSTERQMPLCT